MSYPATIALKNAAGTVENFIRIGQEGDTVKYLLGTSTLSAPVELTIGHQMTKSADGSDRHMAKISRTVIGTDLKPRPSVWNLTGSVPRSTVTRTNVDDCLAELKEFISQMAMIDALLRGEK